MKKVIFENSHVYVGSLATFSFRPMPRCVYLEVKVEFEDLSFSTCDIEVEAANEIILYIASYKTSKGTLIGAKSWKLTPVEDTIWKVAANLS